MIKSIRNFLIIFFIFQQLQSQISQFDKNGLIGFCEQTLHILTSIFPSCNQFATETTAKSHNLSSYGILEVGLSRQTWGIKTNMRYQDKLEVSRQTWGIKTNLRYQDKHEVSRQTWGIKTNLRYQDKLEVSRQTWGIRQTECDQFLTDRHFHKFSKFEGL